MPRVFGRAAKMSLPRYRAVSPNIGFVDTPGHSNTSAASNPDHTTISSEILMRLGPRFSFICVLSLRPLSSASSLLTVLQPQETKPLTCQPRPSYAFRTVSVTVYFWNDEVRLQRALSHYAGYRRTAPQPGPAFDRPAFDASASRPSLPGRRAAGRSPRRHHRRLDSSLFAPPRQPAQRRGRRAYYRSQRAPPGAGNARLGSEPLPRIHLLHFRSLPRRL